MDVSATVTSKGQVTPPKPVRDALGLRAGELYDWKRPDFAETYLAAAAETWGIGRVVSFDKALDRLGGVAGIEP